MSYTFAGQWGPDSMTTRGGFPLVGLSCQINVHGGGAATLYTDRTKATHATNPVLTDSDGNLVFWADPGVYDIVGNGATITVSLDSDPSEPVIATNAVTQAPLDNSTKIATTAYDDAAVAVEKARAISAEAGKQAGPLTGDVTTSGAAATLATVATPGTTGDASHVAQVTIDAKGRTTTATAVAIAIAESAVTNLTTDLAGKQAGPLTGDVTTSGAAATLAGVITAGGPTGSGTAVPVITYDAKGRLTAVTTSATVGTVAATDSSIVVGGTATAPTIQRAALTGDITASAGSNATTLKNTGPGATGPIGDATHVATVTIDAQGRVTALTSTAITGGGSGTVTSVSVASANGFAGTVATATTTPAITISTTVTGLLKGNGTSVVAATAGTDYLTVLTGDVTTSGNAATLKNTGPGATGPIGDASHTSAVTIDAQGRVTALTSTAIAIAESAVTNLTTDLAGKQAGPLTGDVTTSGAAATLASVGPGATGPIGSPSVTPVVTIDAKGRVTALTSAHIARTPFYLLAAANSLAAWKNAADFICTGTSSSFIDDVTINSAIAALGGAGTIVLAEGDYYIGSNIIPVSGVSILGQGMKSTVIHAGWSLATYSTQTCNFSGTSVTLHGGGNFPAAVINGMSLVDTTTGGNVPANTVVVSGAGTATLTVSNTLTTQATGDSVNFQAVAIFPCIDIYDQTAFGTNPVNGCQVRDMGFSYDNSISVVGAPLSGLPGGARNEGTATLACAVYVNGNDNVVEDIAVNNMVMGVGVSGFFRTGGFMTTSNDGAMTSCLALSSTTTNPLPALPPQVTLNCVLTSATTITLNGGGNFPASVIAGMALWDNTTPGNITLPTTVVSGMGTSTLTLSQATGTAANDSISFQANQLVVTGTTQNWTAANVGDCVEVVGAGGAAVQNTFVAMIVQVNSTKCVVLDCPALTTVGPTATVRTLKTGLGYGRAANNWVKNINCTLVCWGSVGHYTELCHFEGIRGSFVETPFGGGGGINPTANIAFSTAAATVTLIGGGNFSASIAAGMAIVDLTNIKAFAPGTTVLSGGGTATLTLSQNPLANSTATVGDDAYFTAGTGPAHAFYYDLSHGADHIGNQVSDLDFTSPTGIGTAMKWGGWVGGEVTGLRAQDVAGCLGSTGGCRQVSVSNIVGKRLLGGGMSVQVIDQYCVYSNMSFDSVGGVSALQPVFGGSFNRFSDILVTTNFPVDELGTYCCSDQGAYNDINGLTMVANNGRNAGIRLFGAGGHNIWDVRGIHLSNLVLGTSNNQARSRINYDPSGSNDVTGGPFCTINASATLGGYPAYSPTEDVTLVTIGATGTVTPDPTLTPTYVYNVTTTAAVTIANPAAYCHRGQRIRFVIQNNTGSGTLAVSWNSCYKFNSPWINPPQGQSVVVEFVAPADVATNVAGNFVEVLRDAQTPGYVSTSTASLPATTLYTTGVQNLTGSTASATLTIGTTSFTAGQVQSVFNNSSVSVTLAAASGSIDTTQLPAAAGIILRFDGTNWNTVAGTGLRGNSSGVFALSTPAPTTGSAFTPLTTGDCELSIKCTTIATYTLTTGPSTGSENTLMVPSAGVVGVQTRYRIPKNWKVIFTGTVADFAFQAQAI